MMGSTYSSRGRPSNLVKFQIRSASENKEYTKAHTVKDASLNLDSGMLKEDYIQGYVTYLRIMD